MAAPTTALTVIKRIPYRGDANEEFSNTYLLTGTTPVDSSAWRTLFDALVAEEKKLYRSTITVVRGYGYNTVPTTGVAAVWSVDLTVSPNSPVAGTFALPGDTGGGDSAWWIRWGLDRFTEKGKRVYLRKYFHPAITPDGAGAGDALLGGLVTAGAAFGAKMDDGSFAAGRKITDKLGTITVGHAVGPWSTTRTLKRRGKRPPT